MPGKMRSRNSTTMTSEPRRRQPDPSSSPITPAPTTSNRFGTLSSTKAPVDDTIRFSSIVIPLSRATSDPVAMTIALAPSVCVPLAPLTSTCPGAAIDLAADALVFELHHGGQIEHGLADPNAHLAE